MKPLRLVLLLVLLTSCRQEVKPGDLNYLNGYWEIKEVVFPSGERKTYNLSQTVDYIETEGLSGFRKKVQPLPDGRFMTSDDAENFTIREKEGSYFMIYTNEMNTWEERISSLSESDFSVVNEEQIRYIYKRYQPIILEEDGPEKK